MSYHPNITQTFSTLAKQTISKATSSSNSSKAQPTTATSSASTSNTANKTCYLVISPNPNSGWYTSDMTQPDKARYHIKIGDGNFRDAYFVSNPSFDYRENSTAPTATINNVRTGKYLERKHFFAELERHEARHVNDVGSSEWHTIATQGAAPNNNGPGSLAFLNGLMRQLLDQFPMYNWQPNQPFDATMNQVFQSYVLED